MRLTTRMTRARVLTVLLAAVSTGCLVADGTVRHDGSGSLTITFPTGATSDDDVATRALLAAPDVTIESLQIADVEAEVKKGERKPRRATAELRTTKVASLADTKLLTLLGVSIAHDPTADGGGTLKVSVKNPSPRETPSGEAPSTETAVVRIRPAGPVVETSGTSKEGVVEWMVPIADWNAGKALELSIAYGPTAAAKPGDRDQANDRDS